ncbi:PTS sugar transporter subunit IIA [Haloimpatiens sp. FM7315]|uniref:PTS sugar transporter subunit IIA n=1 Tax=Haloimpatiens sp. FM7315 TaxID=3298609 RepID=UPI0035A2C60E
MEKLINEELIILDMEALTKEEAINELALCIDKQDRLISYNGYVKKVFDRENEFSTAVGYEVAIPHGKSDSVKSAALAFGRLKDDIKWSEEESVRYVFLIAVPEKEAGNRHLQILAQISRGLMREEFREKLKNASTKDQILEILNN